MTKTKAKNLASGDTVHFPKLGKLKILLITGASAWSVSFLFSDGKTHTLENERLVEADPATDAPEPLPGEVERLDLETNRVSLTSPLPFHLWGFADIKTSFDPLRGRVSSTRESILSRELLAGATLFTEKAVYQIPVRETPAEKQAA